MSVDLAAVIAVILMLVGGGHMLLGVVVWRGDLESRPRQLFAVTCAAFALWSICFALMTIARDAASAHMWWGAGFFCITLAFPSWLLFLASLSQVRITRAWVFYFLFLYTASVSLGVACVSSDGVRLLHTVYGYQFQYSGPLFTVNLLYQVLLLAIFLLLSLRWRRSTPPPSCSRPSGHRTPASGIITPTGGPTPNCPGCIRSARSGIWR